MVKFILSETYCGMLNKPSLSTSQVKKASNLNPDGGTRRTAVSYSPVVIPARTGKNKYDSAIYGSGRRMRYKAPTTEDPERKKKLVEKGRKKRLISQYNAYLRKAISMIGHSGTTSDSELRSAMSKLGMGTNSVGTICQYRELKGSGKRAPRFYIANNKCTPPGEHWVAYAYGKKYDPLGKDASKSAEQSNSETNCGQRCIAYLNMCKNAGRPIDL